MIYAYIFIHLTSLINGYAILRYFAIKRKDFYMIPIFSGVGFAFLVILLTIFGIVIINGIILLIEFFILLTAILSYHIRFRREKHNKLKTSKLEIVKQLFLFIIYIYPVLYFAKILENTLWANPGDLVAHGAVISALMYHKRISIPLKLFLLSSENYLYHLGFHVISAYIADLFNLYSIESALVVGAYICSLAPSILFSITFSLTSSLQLSLIPYLSVFYIDPYNLERWLFGYFYNGPYPCLTGIVSFLVTFAMLILLTKFNAELSVKILLLSLCLSQILITYPTFLFPFIVYFIYLLLRRVKKRHLQFYTFKNAFLIIFIIATMLCLALIFSSLTHSIVKFLYYFANIAYKYYIYTFRYALADLTVIIAIILSFFNFFKRDLDKNLRILTELFVIITMPIVLTGINKNKVRLIDVLGALMTASRLFVIAQLLAWIVIVTTIGLLVRSVSDKHGCVSQRARHVYVRVRLGKYTSVKILNFPCVFNLILVIIFAIILYPYIYRNIIFEIPNKWLWYQKYFKKDYELLSWVSKNIPPEDLILNDLSFAGLFIPSFSYKNVVFSYFPPKNAETFENLKKVFLEPNNETLVKEAIFSNNIKWIVITCEWGYLDIRWEGINMLKTYRSKTYNYTDLFQKYTFLKKVYSTSGCNGVYAVIGGRE